LAEKFLAARCPKLIHNYFPPPRKPFVLNLASSNDAIRAASLAHGNQGLALAADAGLPFYSVHAGFGIDPDPSRLGKPFGNADAAVSRVESQKRFVESLRLLLAEADRRRVDLLVENNVVIQANRNIALLCDQPEEISTLFKNLPHPRLGLLLDTGHLHVTAKTFGFDPHAAVDTLRPYVRALHHSDNDALRDSNQPLGPAYWFSRHWPKFRDLWHVLEVDDLTPEEAAAQIAWVQKTATAEVTAC
jgi:sugar phosphate isomerase/epimerase